MKFDVALFLVVGEAWADHGGPLRTAGWSPLTAALLFGGLALLKTLRAAVGEEAEAPRRRARKVER